MNIQSRNTTLTLTYLAQGTGGEAPQPDLKEQTGAVSHWPTPQEASDIFGSQRDKEGQSERQPTARDGKKKQARAAGKHSGTNTRLALTIAMLSAPIAGKDSKRKATKAAKINKAAMGPPPAGSNTDTDTAAQALTELGPQPLRPHFVRASTLPRQEEAMTESTKRDTSKHAPQEPRVTGTN